MKAENSEQDLPRCVLVPALWCFEQQLELRGSRVRWSDMEG